MQHRTWLEEMSNRLIQMSYVSDINPYFCEFYTGLQREKKLILKLCTFVLHELQGIVTIFKEN